MKSLDDLLDEIGDNCEGNRTRASADCKVCSISQPRVTEDVQHKIKCPFPYIGGSSYPCEEQTICARLKCLDCDNLVIDVVDRSFVDVEVLGLRNSYPFPEKLAKELHKSVGCRAYFCQCKSINAKERKLVPPKLNWVCGKH